MRASEFVTENLRDWFKEKWVRFGPDGKIRGDCARGSSKEGKPKCLPQAKAHALGKKGRAAAAQKKRREDPNPERRGKAINVATKVKEDDLDENCWKGYHKDGMKTMFGKRYPNCVKNKNESLEVYVNRGECPGCGGVMVSEDQINEKQDACYHKVKSRYKVWPSAYASGALVQCRKKGASNWGNSGKNEDVTEAPIANTDDPMNPVIHGHEKANPMTLQGRIGQARNQLRDLARMADSNDLATWEQITKLARGGMFMGLEQNLEQIRHGIEELAKKRKKGGVASRGISKDIG